MSDTGSNATTGCSRIGIVVGSTYILDTKVTGIDTSRESVITTFAVRTANASAVKIHPNSKAKPLGNTSAAIIPRTPDCGR